MVGPTPACVWILGNSPHKGQISQTVSHAVRPLHDGSLMSSSQRRRSNLSARMSFKGSKPHFPDESLLSSEDYQGWRLSPSWWHCTVQPLTCSDRQTYFAHEFQHTTCIRQHVHIRRDIIGGGGVLILTAFCQPCLPTPFLNVNFVSWSTKVTLMPSQMVWFLALTLFPSSPDHHPQ